MRGWLLVLAMMCVGGAARAELAYVAGGCFWCVEADFEGVPGVREVTSGYMGGTRPDPTYRGHDGYLEAVAIDYDPARISYAALLRLFLRSVDPTDPDGQFCDRGASYRTAIFVATGAERAAAEAALAEAAAHLGTRVVTPVRAAGRFWRAEDYHQDYAKSRDLIVTRFGLRQKRTAYRLYRAACGRDARVRALWGAEAAFAR